MQVIRLARCGVAAMLLLAAWVALVPVHAGMGTDIENGQDLEELGAAPLTSVGGAMMQRRVFTERYTDDLDDLIRKRVIRVLVNMNRTDFFVIDGEPRGFEYEMMQNYKAYLRTRVRPRSWPVIFVFIPTPFDQLISGVVEGRGDVAAAGLTVTPERQDLVAFTEPYLSNVKEVVVTAKRVKNIKTLDDLAGRTVFVKPDTSYAEHLARLNEEFRAAGKDPIEIVEAPSRLATEDILELVNAGIVEITVSDEHIAKIWDEILPNLKVHDDIVVHSGGDIAWVVRKDNPELNRSLSVITKKHRQGSLIGNVLFKRYYEDTKWVDNPLTPKQLDNLQELQKLFKAYAKKFGFDWMAIAAVSFQESRLDHSVVSPVGAVGIMQVMPATAEAPPIEIPDVHEVENNIHAGVKYLAFLRENYFNDPDITPADRVDFTLAAYNAGPNRVNRLRRAAKRAGLNPNVWFGHVEQIARRTIGRETVDYVANVNKYYIAYRLAFREWEARERAISEIRASGTN